MFTRSFILVLLIIACSKLALSQQGHVEEVETLFYKTQRYDQDSSSQNTIDESKIMNLLIEEGVLTRDIERATMMKAAPQIAPRDSSELDLVFYKKEKLVGPSQFDSRVEILQLDPSVDWQLEILKNSRSVGVFVKKEMLHKIADSTYQVSSFTSLGDKYNLCSTEPFREQPVIGDGTGFLIGEQEVMTAGHVLPGSLSDYALIFGFELINKEGGYTTFIEESNIFYPKERILYDEELDYTVVRLDRSTNRKGLTVSRSGNRVSGSPVYMIGHPSGLPQKVSVNASIRSSHNQFYMTTLDAFQGNSGSPVFDLETHEIIGILVSGDVDFKWNGSCNTINICSLPYCGGEKVMKVNEAVLTLIESNVNGGF